MKNSCEKLWFRAHGNIQIKKEKNSSQTKNKERITKINTSGNDGKDRTGVKGERHRERRNNGSRLRLVEESEILRLGISVGERQNSPDRN